MSALENLCSQSKQAYSFELAVSALQQLLFLQNVDGIAMVVTVVTGQVVVDIAVQSL